MLAAIHRRRRAFLLANGLFILVPASFVLLSPRDACGLLGVDVGNAYVGRLMAWYLLTFGVGAVLAAFQRQDNPLLLGMLALEKAGTVALGAATMASVGGNAWLAASTLVDGALALILFAYVRWLTQRPPAPRHRAGR